jgi:hypothetical protein
VTCNCGFYQGWGRSLTNATREVGSVSSFKVRKATQMGVVLVPVSQQSAKFETIAEKQPIDLNDLYEVKGGSSFVTSETYETV